MTSRAIVLSSRAHYGRRVPPEDLGGVLTRLPSAVRRSVRMAVEGRSRASGRRPEWLRAATDIRFLGHDGDDQTVLHFDAPMLGEAAPRLYEQRELWPTKPDPADTGFDVLADVFQDVSERNADSERFDGPLLESLYKLGTVFRSTISEIGIPRRRDTAGGPFAVTPDVVENARNLYTNTPHPRRVRVVGKLDMLRASTQSFGVVLDDGQEIRGVMLDGDVEEISPLLSKRILVTGMIIYRPSGRPLRIDAEAFEEATSEGSFFSSIPKPHLKRFDLRETAREQHQKRGVAAIVGKWPGNETDDEIRQALQDLS